MTKKITYTVEVDIELEVEDELLFTKTAVSLFDDYIHVNPYTTYPVNKGLSIKDVDVKLKIIEM